MNHQSITIEVHSASQQSLIIVRRWKHRGSDREAKITLPRIATANLAAQRFLGFPPLESR